MIAFVGAAALAVSGCGSAFPESLLLQRLRDADAHLAMGAPADAERAYRAALALRPDSARALHGLSRALLDRGDPVAALGVLDELEQIGDTNANEWADVDRCAVLRAALSSRLEAGDSISVLVLSRRHRSADCSGPELARLIGTAHLLEAQTMRDLGDDAAALRHYRRALATAPSLVGAWLGAAELLVRSQRAQRTDEAIALLTDALERHPNDRRLHALMVEVLGMRYSTPIPGTLDGTGQAGDRDHERDKNREQ